MARTRIKLAVYVDLDDTPGAMHSAESARNLISSRIHHMFHPYNPMVSIESWDTTRPAQDRSPLVQLELALHDADCPGHDEAFEGHGDKYQKLAEAALAVFPPDREPFWLKDRKMVQESSLNIIMQQLQAIQNRVGA